MLNVVLGGVVCASCIAVGWWQRRRYRKRVDVMRDLVAFLVFCEEQIEYNMASLPAIFGHFYALHPHSAFAAACSAFPTFGSLHDLPEDAWRAVQDLLLALGRSDERGQGARLAYAKAEAETMLETAVEVGRKRGDLYAKLWQAAGIGLMIWMV